MSTHHGAASVGVLDDDPVRIRLFDFSRQETIERSRLRLLRPLLESATGRIASTMSSGVRQIVHLTIPEEFIQLSWEEYAQNLPDPTFISTTLIAPFDRRFVLHIPVPLALLLIDYSLGGDAGFQPDRDDLTDIERSLLAPLVAGIWSESIVPSLSSSLELRAGPVQNSNSPIFVQVGRPGEICLIVEMGLTVAGSENYTISLALSVSAVMPIIESLERAQSGEAMDTNDTNVTQVERGLQLVPVELKVSYPSVRFTPAELVDLCPGDVLPLHPRAEVGLDLLEIVVGDAVFARGVLVEDGRNLTVTVTDIEETTND